MTSSKIIIGESEIKIEHRECSDSSWCKNEGLYLESRGENNNTLTEITYNDYLKIYLFWASFSTGVSQEILLVPETGVLFVGCGSLSARISVTEKRIIGKEEHFLFWGLSRHKECILELGETDCFLYSITGEKIDYSPVDPPYEMDVLENGIKFESSIYGTTWLKYS